MAYSIDPNPRVPFEVRYVDEYLLVVDKAAGVVTQPGMKHQRDSLLNGLFVKYGKLLQKLGEARSWGLLHRLDKPTSGLVLVALRVDAYDRLREQFERRKITKTYLAIIAGRPRIPQGVIQKPIVEITGRGRKKAVIKQGGSQAITAYRVLGAAGDACLIEARPKTGRLHQIRVHLAALGHPVLGDGLYGDHEKAESAPRLCLHAAELSFAHPNEPRRVTVKAPVPADFARTLRRLGLAPVKDAAVRER